MPQVQMFILNSLTLNMFRALLCPSSGEQTIRLRVVFAWLCWLRSCGAGTRAVRTVWKWYNNFCLVVLAAVMWSWDTSCTHCVNVGIPTLTQCVQLVSQLHTTAANTTRQTPCAILHSLFPWRWAWWCPKHDESWAWGSVVVKALRY